ncbi:unnamed protein product [Diatraea saccharalis]|uniref:Uncharacterized protein n=1 Tax=Diatraea saccharalis TaxID=40085 RepID=A0A9N9R141_9NEOP|nr:unnamed protein product [Diatraea saccharalis]
MSNARYRRRFQYKPSPIVPTSAPNFPSNMPSDILELFKVPSNEFCSQMIIQPSHHYVVLPWWYYYCQNMKEKKFLKDNKRMPNFGHYKVILERVKQYKKRHGEETDMRRHRPHYERL